MKVLLANIPWVTEEEDKYGVRAGSRWAHTRDKNIETVTYFPFPFFMAYTTALLKKNNINATIKDCIAEGMNKSEFFSFLEKEKFDVIILETSTASIYNDLKMTKEIKEKFGLILVLCGTHTSALYDSIMKENPFIDFIMYGEYDYTALELVKTIEKDKDFKKVDGIVYRDGKKIVVNPRRELIKNLDELPWPERKELPMLKYNEPFCKSIPNVQMIATRGCPNNCIYCVEPTVYYGKPNFRRRSPKDVVDEIEFLISKYKPKEIYFDDASFTLGQRQAKEISEEIIRRGIKTDWSCMGDAKVSFETLKIMKKSGCIGIKFGVESGNPHILKNIRKFINLEDVKRMVKDCKKLGIFTHATYMFGLPGETKETIKKTIDFSVNLKTDTAQFSVATPYPGTDFFKMCEENGWLLTKDWSKYDGSECSVISLPECPKELMEVAIKDAKKKLFIGVLKNPKVLRRYVISSYKSDGLPGLFKNAVNKAKFIASKKQ